MRALIIAEHDNQELKPATLATVTAGLALCDDVDLLVVGHNCETVVDDAAHIVGIGKVVVVGDELHTHLLAENISQVALTLADGYDYILAPATTFGKNFMPRIAAKLDVMQLSDIIKVVDANTFVRPIYAGNALQTVQSSDSKKVVTVRATAFDKARLGESKAGIEVHDADVASGQSSFVRHELTKSERPELTAARVVVSGGRGVGSAENFKLIEDLADKLNAGIGASRAAVDAGYVPNDYQVGQTGKVVAPELYIAIGISGAIQHLAGMQDSKVIVAINKDEDAPIFQIADYGLVGDLFELVPELINQL